MELSPFLQTAETSFMKALVIIGKDEIIQISCFFKQKDPSKAKYSSKTNNGWKEKVKDGNEVFSTNGEINKPSEMKNRTEKLVVSTSTRVLKRRRRKKMMVAMILLSTLISTSLSKLILKTFFVMKMVGEWITYMSDGIYFEKT